MTYTVTRWDGDVPAEKILRERMESEGLTPYTWSNLPGDQYAAHRHGYGKVIFVVSGSISFGLPEIGETVELHAGDRLDLPAGLLHDASVGPEGVRCLEGHH
jgi:quercetin dioxygenase-like cupin family protein